MLRFWLVGSNGNRLRVVCYFTVIVSPDGSTNQKHGEALIEPKLHPLFFMLVGLTPAWITSFFLLFSLSLCTGHGFDSLSHSFLPFSPLVQEQQLRGCVELSITVYRGFNKTYHGTGYIVRMEQGCIANTIHHGTGCTANTIHHGKGFIKWFILRYKPRDIA